MNNVLFRRGDQTFIDKNVPLNDGQIIFNETDEAIYLDNTIGGTVVRKRYGGGNLSRSDIDMALSTTSKNPIANKVVTNAIGNLSRLQTDVKTNLVSAINEVDTHTNTAQSTANTANGKAGIVQAQVSNSGDTYSSSKAYAVGDLCIYNNVLYRCITACSAGSWAINQSCFTQDTLTGVCNSIGAKKVSKLQFDITASSASEFLTILRQNVFACTENLSFIVDGKWLGQAYYVGYGKKTDTTVYMEVFVAGEAYWENYLVNTYEHQYIVSKTQLN